MQEKEKERFLENQEKRAEKAKSPLIFDPHEPIERVNPFSLDSAEKFRKDIKEEKRES